MNFTVVVSSRGQVVIPVNARKKLNIKEGDILLGNIEEDGKLVFKTGKRDRVKKGIVDQSAGILSDLDIDGMNYVESLRKDSGRRLDNLEGRD
ncbi:hypothetical protein DCCM_2251 [Desulfocucumis palustris]|uniref:SpoVT-AbrB domain-containing protein n=1 Tax=Desulfocucumis palustris TaxID=1898651 RepID=A0A2L2XAZ5_9FIRM|nr:AbrB/MazE/SpoVT family DNA-binding domain-containing protein [Desulfocucumis palustris]GBF33154.1 hypothetical protein DCCM_2251 [Desulfocucumis palustris]